ncbi:Uncharacterized protein APZ42_008519, partial [Daphnia magna]
ITASTGVAQKDACIQALTEWKLKDNVIAAPFTIQLQVIQAHIAECHIKRTQKKIGGPTTGPTYKLFSRFKQDYNSFQQLITEEFEVLDYDELGPFMTSQEWVENCWKKNVFPGEDYRELCELMTVFLGATLSHHFIIRRRGADHHARFMSKAIYYLKIYLLQNLFHLRPKEVKEVKRMAIYIAVFYGKYFLETSLTSSALVNDLRFLCAMHQYALVDKEAANETIHSINLHLDYLTQELVPFALFDPRLAEEEKNKLAHTLISIPRPSEFAVGKPKTPTITWRQDDQPILSDLLGERSWLMFHLLQLHNRQEWMLVPSNLWILFEDFRVAKEFVDFLITVNDCAERGIKLIGDYRDSCPLKESPLLS